MRTEQIFALGRHVGLYEMMFFRGQLPAFFPCKIRASLSQSRPTTAGCQPRIFPQLLWICAMLFYCFFAYGELKQTDAI